MTRAVVILLLALVGVATAGIYCYYDLLGEEHCWTTLTDPPSSWRTGVVEPERAGEADYYLDERRLGYGTTKYAAWLLKKARLGGANTTTLRTWADCLEKDMGKVTDEHMACLRQVMTYVQRTSFNYEPEVFYGLDDLY